MTNEQMIELVSGWSCDERNRAACRNSHGCHCREITVLRAGTFPGNEIHSSDGGSRGLPFDPADAAGVKSGTVTETGKQEGRTGSEVGASQTPGSSMSFGPAKPITAEQAFGPSETPSQPPQAGAVPVAWAERIGGRIVSVRLDKSVHCTEPLYAAPPAAPLVREALERAEKYFELIRLKLINHLNEPERSAFWTAVEARDAMHAALSSPHTESETK
jgi:hypothetical protein